jgi:hypothetical protein
MATEKNPTRSSILERKAAQRAQADKMRLKTRVASAWTLAKTMLPGAPAPVQMKFAKTLLANSTTILKEALKQTSVNAYSTKLAEKFESEHKVSLNEFLDDPSVLTKAENAVKTELKGEPKNAAEKKAQDEGTGEQPADYKNDGRTEPAGMDASKVEGSKTLNEGLEADAAAVSKEATKTAHGKDCKGCSECDKKAKEAKAKKAEGEFPPAEGAPALEAPVEEGAPVEGDVPAEGEVAAEEEAPAEEPASEEAPAEEGEQTEQFDAEIADLQDTKDTLKDDIETLEEKIDAVVDAADTIEVGEEEIADDSNMLEEALGDDAVADGEVSDAVEGEELDLASIFNDDVMGEKAAALSGETTEAADFDDFAGEDFFGPSDAADLEVALDQEEIAGSPADMFATDGAGDPMAGLFNVTASEDSSVVLPGHLDDYFATDLSGDDRDSETDHNDLLSAAIDSVDQASFPEHRSQDQEPKLEEPKQAAGKKHIQKLRPQAPKTAAAAPKLTGRSIAALLMGEDND